MGTGDYTLMLGARGAELEYRDAGGIYRFSVAARHGGWVVYLPCSKGEHHAIHELTPDEHARVVPRITAYLGGRRPGPAALAAPVILLDRTAPPPRVVRAVRHPPPA